MTYDKAFPYYDEYIIEYQTKQVTAFKVFYGWKYTYLVPSQHQCNTSIRDFAFDLGCSPDQ